MSSEYNYNTPLYIVFVTRRYDIGRHHTECIADRPSIYLLSLWNEVSASRDEFSNEAKVTGPTNQASTYSTELVLVHNYLSE